jgi:excisionase family DNA binding protein
MEKKKISAQSLKDSGYNGEILLKGREVQEIFKISRSKLKQMVQQGEIKPYRLGKRTIRFSADRIRDYLENLDREEQSKTEKVQNTIYSPDEVTDLSAICGNVEFAE